MIAWLKGTVVDIDGNEIIVNTGNVGYRVIVGSNLKLEKGIKVGESIEFAVFTSVKEDEIRLFGFETFFVRKIFVILLTVNGVGPKVALNIVDKIEPLLIVEAIKTNDFSRFLAVSGVGKKTAQRIVLDLQGKVEALCSYGGFTEELEQKTNLENDLFYQSRLLDDARSALANLGFAQKEGDRVLRKHLKPGMELDEILRLSLRELR